jgi:hypothetical protein
MAQWRKDNQAYDNQSTRHEVMMISDQYGNINKKKKDDILKNKGKM